MDAAPATLGRYRVLAELGRGAMGIVYRAEDTTLGREVAVKTIALTGGRDERDTHEGRFLQEARAAGRLSHPAIVTIYEMGREGDVAFMAMELLEGADLRALIREATLAPAHALEIAAAVADGLAFAHERGVVHRDVKPGNIMVLGDGRVKIMDFGIARLQEPTVKTQTGVLLGSPQYMAPEQIVGQPVDHRADIFSLGLVLYEMLTGEKPFAGEDIPELTFKVANLAARPPSHLAPHLPAVVDYIVARALRKKPGERYASAAEMSRDLRAALPEVRAAEGAWRERAAAATRPQAGAAGPDLMLATTGAAGADEDAPALRASPRFDSRAGLARLAVLPADATAERSRAGWTMPLRRAPRRIPRTRWLTAAAYLLALAAALAIVLL